MVEDSTSSVPVPPISHEQNPCRTLLEAGQQMTMQNVGFAMVFQFDNHTAALAPSDGTRWADPDMPEQWESRSGAVGQFRWSGA